MRLFRSPIHRVGKAQHAGLWIAKEQFIPPPKERFIPRDSSPYAYAEIVTRLFSHEPILLGDAWGPASEQPQESISALQTESLRVFDLENKRYGPIIRLSVRAGYLRWNGSRLEPKSPWRYTANPDLIRALNSLP